VDAQEQGKARARFLLRLALSLFAGIFAMFLSAPSSAAAASNIYISQNGGGTGTSCSSASSVAWFNNSGNWGSGSAQIGPGTTVHLCGTFTGTAGQTLLTFQGSGTSGSPITLLFESGANLTAPYWNGTDGAIYVNGLSYITIDGGTNGTIQNTENGTGLAYEQPSAGVRVNNSSNVTIQNLTVANICQHTAVTDLTGCIQGGNGDGGILINGPAPNLLVTKNTVHDSENCIFYGGANGDTGVTISDNTVSRCNWGVGADQSGTSSGFTVTGNDISQASNWDDANDGAFHHNGIMIFPQNGDVMNNVVIANNYIHDINGHETAHIFLDPSGTGDLPGVRVYNNVLTTTTGGGPANAFITDGAGVSGALVFNNTISGAGAQGISGQVSPTFKNNIITGMTTGISLNSGYTNVTSGSNDLSGLINTVTAGIDLDASSITGNPELTSNYMLGPGSPAAGKGTNLTSLGITGLDTGAPQYFGISYACGAGCQVRPSTGPWDMGAYYQGSVVGNQPSPPTGLIATVQ